MARLDFNANEVAPDAGGREPWPEGWHTVIINESDVENVKKEGSKSAYLKLTIISTNGVPSGSQDLIFNIFNESADAVRIAKGQLTKLCHVLGKTGMVGDSRELHNIPFQVRMEHQKTERGAILSRARDYRFTDGRELPKPGTHAQHVPPGAIPNSAMPPQAAPPAGFGAPPPAPGFGVAPPQPGYGQQPPAPPPQQPQYAPQPPAPPQPQYGAPPPGYAPQPPAPPQAQPPGMPGYGAPPAPPQAPNGQYAAPPGGFQPPPGHQPWGGPQQ